MNRLTAVVFCFFFRFPALYHSKRPVIRNQLPFCISIIEAVVSAFIGTVVPFPLCFRQPPHRIAQRRVAFEAATRSRVPSRSAHDSTL